MKKIYKLRIDVSTSTEETRSGHAFYDDYDTAVKEFERWKDIITKRWNLRIEDGEYTDDKGEWDVTNTKRIFDKYYRCQFRSNDRNDWIIVYIELDKDTLLEGDEFLAELCGAICKDDTDTYFARIVDYPLLSTDKNFRIVDIINMRTKKKATEKIDPDTHFYCTTLEEERNYYKTLEQIKNN